MSDRKKASTCMGLAATPTPCTVPGATATTATSVNRATAPALSASTARDRLGPDPTIAKASSAPAPTMAVAANDARHRPVLAGSTSENRLMRPGRASWRDTAEARRRWDGLALHSR